MYIRWLLFLWLGWLLWTKRKAAIRAHHRPVPKPDGAQDYPAAAPQKTPLMLACAHCGVHVPQPDTVLGLDQRVYCSPAHRLATPGAT